jgi:hypothetical protein
MRPQVLTFIVYKSRILNQYFVIPNSPEKSWYNPEKILSQPILSRNRSFQILPVPIPTEVKMFILQGSGNWYNWTNDNRGYYENILNWNMEWTFTKQFLQAYVDG